MKLEILLHQTDRDLLYQIFIAPQIVRQRLESDVSGPAFLGNVILFQTFFFAFFSVAKLRIVSNYNLIFQRESCPVDGS